MVRIVFTVFASIMVMFLLCRWLSIKIDNVPLDNDEYYSQVSSVQQASWEKIWSGRIEEGNNSPLFYSLQKIYQIVIGYKTPSPWLKGQWGYVHPPSQRVLRIIPMLCMALGVTILFAIMTYLYGWLAGFYALAISLTSFMVLTYAVIARPYALWFMLTSAQLSFLLLHLQAKKKEQSTWFVLLVAVSILLSLTVVFGIVSTLAVGVVLYLNKMISIRKTILLVVVPLVIAIFYYAQAPKYTFFIKEGMANLVFANIPLERFLLIGIGFSAVLLGKIKALAPYFQTRKMLLGFLPMGVYAAVVLAGCFGILFKFYLGQNMMREGFEVSNRYLMVLAPVGIVMTVLASMALIQSANKFF